MLGALLVMYALFVVPGETQKYENLLVRWWVWVEERREAGLRWPAALTVVVARTTTDFLDRWFGPRLLSAQACAVSLALSVFTFSIMVATHMSRIRIGSWYFEAMPSIETAVPVLLFATLLFTLRYMPTRYWLAVVIAAIALVCIPLLIPGVTSVSTDPPRFGDLYRLILPYHVALVGIVSLCWSLTSDIVFIALTRYLIRVVAGPGLPALRITAMSIGMLLAGLALVSVPFATLRMVVNVWPAGSVTLLAPFLLISTAMNVANLLVAAVFLFIALAMLVHRIVWPLIGRPLEVISAEHVLLKRWPLFFTGIALLGVSWAPFGAWLKLLQGK